VAAKKSLKKKAEFKFFQWLRSGLRSMSRRYPPIYEALAAAKVPYKGSNARQKVAYKCAACGGSEFSSKQVAVDHRVDCGTLQSWGDVKGFMERLFCGKEGLDVLCNSCHDLKTYSTKYSVTLEEAALAKQVLEICKWPKRKLLDFIMKEGYNEQECSNAAKRKKLVEIILKEKTNVCTN